MNSYDEQTVIKWTVAQEAADQPYLGKLAVAWVIVNRMRKWKKSAAGIAWQAYQFSCWNGKLSACGSFLDKVPASVMYECGKAAVQAYNSQVADPTNGATFYLNKDLTIKMNGSLPDWVDKMVWTAKIGEHDFYKEA